MEKSPAFWFPEVGIPDISGTVVYQEVLGV